MNRLLLLLLLAAALYAWQMHDRRTLTLPAKATATWPDISEDEVLEIALPGADMDYYDVGGNSAAEIRNNLNRQHRGGYDGYTGWHVRWQWPGYGQADCRLQEATLDTTLRVRLPRWQPPPNPDPALVQQWNRYLVNLARHEYGHVQMAQQGFAELRAVLAGSDCLNAEGRLNAVLARMRDADRRFDAETAHGRTQGAQFP